MKERSRANHRSQTVGAGLGNPARIRAEKSSTSPVTIARSLIRLKLTSAPGGATIPDVFWEVRDSTDETVWRATESEPRGILAAGRYKVRAETRDKRLEKMVDIKAGEAKTLEFTIE